MQVGLPVNVGTFETGIGDLVDCDHQARVRGEGDRVGLNVEVEVWARIRLYGVETPAPDQVLVRVVRVSGSPRAGNSRLVACQLLAGALAPVQGGRLSAAEIEVSRWP
jgi:hypothetical protein